MALGHELLTGVTEMVQGQQRLATAATDYAHLTQVDI